MVRKSLVQKFCGCIKKVRRTFKPRKGTRKQTSQSEKSLRQKRLSSEQAAIAVCTKSVLQSRGKTLKKFSCRNGKLLTQKMF